MAKAPVIGSAGELLVEFVSGMSQGGSIMGSYEQTQRLLSGFLKSDKVDGVRIYRIAKPDQAR